jgi:hypothetical protein
MIRILRCKQLPEELVPQSLSLFLTLEVNYSSAIRIPRHFKFDLWLRSALAMAPSPAAAGVARWYMHFQIKTWVNFVGSCNGRCWYILRTFGLFYGYFGLFNGHVAYFVFIWNILW